ncbi:MAG: diacylglycerol kinase [Gammaproteobacteria bacterium]|nr:diacylglycerol kinase [Gammaproteobacteria bacterium]MDH5241399.1 diacylglycerol kinase [Gammaproteobacteria bacterium]MDH5261164.1 diacylglycerol kinase [Gammaproteobacteria bacterium]MDH5582913.1 diacylglycerol kinase [Gammaproteobacteria bacterium]
MSDYTSKFPRRTGISRILYAGWYSLRGFREAWVNESAFRQEAVLAVILIPAAFWLGETPVEQILLIGSVALVLIVELLNSAVETTVNRIGTEIHPLSGRAKDMGSAAVLVSLLLTLFVWGTIFVARFY